MDSLAKPQMIVTPSGERLVVLGEDAYERLIEATEQTATLAAHEAFRRKLSDGDEELVPAKVADRIIDGENPVRVWRDHRGLSASELADKAGLAQAFISQIETGKREGTVATLRKIADALGLKIDDLVD